MIRGWWPSSGTVRRPFALGDQVDDLHLHVGEALAERCDPAPRRGRRLRRVGLVDNVQAPAVHNLLDQPHERPDELAEQWHARGLVDVSTGELWVSADYESFDDLFQPFTAGTGHSGACYTSLDRAGQNRLRDETHHRLGEPDGAFTLTARAWWARGRVPVR